MLIMTEHKTTPAPASGAPRNAAPRARLRAAKAVLSDLDGCLAASNIALPGAAEIARELGERLIVVSNNSSHDPLGLSQELALNGLEIPPHRIVLAGLLAVETIARDRPRCRVLILGSAVLRARARMLGLDAARRDADVVLVARDTAFDYTKLETAVQELARGADLYAANPDLSHPGRSGRIVPETGALLAAIRACVPDVPCRTIGKPEPAIYREALARAGCDAADAIMLGDNPDTDIAGARELGMDTLLIGSHRAAEIPDLTALL
jgi:HAD superfamily hydrolase (TIGR01450 family)